MPVDKTIVTVPESNDLPDIEFSLSDSLYNNIWISIHTRRGSRINDPEFGSRLHELKNAKLTAGTVNKAKLWVADCLKWIKTIGRVSKILANVEIDSEIETRLNIYLTLIKSDEKPVTYNLWYDLV